MRPRSRKYVRNGLVAFSLLLLTGWLAPSYFNAERYRHRLQAGLERALDRRVTFGAVSFRLLPHPGFSIANAVVREDPAFGSEPFARVERIDCDLRWRSLLHSRLAFSRLYLDRPSFNLVRNADGAWNVESFLRQTGLASPEISSRGVAVPRDNLDIAASDARIDFKVGVNKKPFAITEARARVNFNRQAGLLTFRLAGSPIRTDLSLPTPGLLQLDGQWTPGTSLEGPLDATLRTQGSLLYDWVPLVTGRNPQIYGVVDAQIHLTGSLHYVKFEGQSLVSQVHRADQPPPPDAMPASVFFRGQFDRTRGRVMIESLDGTFADSRLHLTGSIDKVPWSPELDLVLAVERSRLEDFVAVTRRLSGRSFTLGVAGRVNALVAIRGPWRQRLYSGFIGGREVVLSTPAGSYPVSALDLRIERTRASLAPATITLAPRVELVVEGAVGPATFEAPPRPRGKKLLALRDLPEPSGPPRYELSLTAQAAPLRDLVSFGRAVGMFSAPGLDARGAATVAFSVSGSAWPFERPTVAGLAELHAARLLVPGLTEPINVPRARILVDADHVTADPVVAVLGTSVFTGRLEHRGDRKQPWEFDIQANRLSLEQGSLWFDALGRRQPVPLLERLPGLSSFGARRVAASNIYGALNARGHFSSPLVTYRALSLADFKTSAEISGRVVHLDETTFRAASGRGQGSAVVDLRSAPANVSLDVKIVDANLQPGAGYLPAALSRVRGTYSGTGHFETRGLSHEEMSANLRGEATLRLKNVFLGGFDPLQAVLHNAARGALEPARSEVLLRSTLVTCQVHDGRMLLAVASPLEVSGAKLKVSGAYNFGGALELSVHADLRRVKRHWLETVDAGRANARLIDLRLAGPLNNLSVVPEMAASRVNP